MRPETASDGEDPPDWELDAFIRTEGWTDEVQTTLSRIGQGSLVTSPPFFYAANGDHSLTSLTEAWARAMREADKRPAGIVRPRPGPPYGICLTNTCDAGELDSRRPKKPWLDFAPVYFLRMTTSRAVEAFETNRRRPGYQAWVSALGHRDDGAWVADLRVVLPIEKGWLVGHETRPAFNDQEEYAAFARLVGYQRLRLPLPMDTQKLILGPLAEFVGALPDALGVDTGIDEVRFDAGRSLDQPEYVRVVVIGAAGVLEAASDAIREWWLEQSQSARLEFELLPIAFESYAPIDPREYEQMESLPLG